MDVTPRELRDVEIREAFRGYNRDEVNDLLERAAAAIEALNEQTRVLQERLASGPADTGRGRETEDMLHRTLLLAQRASDEAIAEAEEKARVMVEEAETRSRELLADAAIEARRSTETERRRLEQEISELQSRRDLLSTDVDGLENFESDYRTRLVSAIESDLHAIERDLQAIRDRAAAAPGDKPALTDVDSAAAVDPSATMEVDVRSYMDAPGAVAEAASAGAAELVGADDTESEESDASRSSRSDAQSTIDLFGEEQAANESAALDDDSFFASLRDAVRDDAPLGPRDATERAFFDQDDSKDAGSFRDTFKRRR
jgi:cell division initiation protein